MKHLALMLLMATGLAHGQGEPGVGRPCDGGESVFVGLPAQRGARARLAPADAPGATRVVTGRVLDRRGEAWPGLVISPTRPTTCPSTSASL